MRFVCPGRDEADAPPMSASGRDSQAQPLELVNQLFKTVAGLATQITALTAEMRELKTPCLWIDVAGLTAGSDESVDARRNEEVGRTGEKKGQHHCLSSPIRKCDSQI